MTRPLAVQTSVVEQSAPAMAPQCARRKICQDVGRSGTGGQAVRSQEAGNCRPTDAMADDRGRSLNARIAPCWILLCHAHDEPLDFL